jgi:hypothetical protein
MGPIMAAALGSGIICGIWAYVGGLLSVSHPELFATWLGFVGITSYFAAGCGKQGIVRSISSNLAGILIGCTIIAMSTGKSDLTGAIITGFFTWVIVYITHIDLTKNAFCTFMGGYSAFATGGNWKMLIICLVLGNIIGHLCFSLGNAIEAKFGRNNKEEWVALKFFED